MVAASVCFLWLAGARGLGLALAAAVIVVNVAAFKLLNRISARVFGRTRIVLLEQWLLTLALTAATLKLGASPVAAGLDAWVVAMSLFLFVGRIGCLLAGCCHGQPADAGMKYPWLVWAYAPQALQQVPLVPVQAYEAILLAAIFTSSLALSFAPHHPGDLLVLFIACYGAGRFGLEFLRGDARPYFMRLSESQWIALGLILAVAATSSINPGPRSSSWLAACGAALVAVALLTAAARGRLGRPVVCLTQKRDIQGITAALKDAWKTALANLTSSEETACRASARTSSGLHVGLEVTVESGCLVERYELRGQQQRLLESAAGVVAVVIKDFRGAGEAGWQMAEQSRGCYSLVRRAAPSTASAREASFTSALTAVLAAGGARGRVGSEERLQKVQSVIEQFEDCCGQTGLSRESNFRAETNLARLLVGRAGFELSPKGRASLRVSHGA